MAGTNYSFAHVETVTLASAAASITFSGLSGTQFEVDGYIVNDADLKVPGLVINGDTGTNYVNQRIGVSNTSITGARDTGQANWRISQTGVPANGTGNFTAFISKPAAGVKAQMVAQLGLDSASIFEQLNGNEWNNTADLITSISIVVAAGTGNFAANSQVSLFSNAGTGGAQWERITTVVLASPAASISVTGIDTDYRKFKALLYAVNDANTKSLWLRFNGDSTSTTYAYQRLSASSTTVAGSRVTGANQIVINTAAVLAASEPGLVSIDASKPVAGVPARVTASASYNATVIYEATASEWANTADLISRIDVLASTNNLAASTRLLLAGQNPA